MIYAFDPLLERLGVISAYKSLIWKQSYNGYGSFTLVTTDAPMNVRLIREGNFLWQRGKDTSMIILYVKQDSVTREITAHGYTSLWLLTKRTVSPAYFAMNAEQSMKGILRNNMRGLSNVLIEDLQGFSDSFEAMFLGDTVYAACNAISTETNIGINMALDYENKKHIFKTYKGADKTQGVDTVLFKDTFGSLPNMTIVNDDSLFKNVIYIAYGPDENRGLLVHGNAQGDDRFELYVDASGVRQEKDMNYIQYTQALIAFGIQQLNEHIKIRTFTAQIDSAKFRQSMYLGDIVKCVSTKYNSYIHARITEFTEVTERNMTTVYLSLGDPAFTVIDDIRLG